MRVTAAFALQKMPSENLTAVQAADSTLKENRVFNVRRWSISNKKFFIWYRSAQQVSEASVSTSRSGNISSNIPSANAVQNEVRDNIA